MFFVWNGLAIDNGAINDSDIDGLVVGDYAVDKVTAKRQQLEVAQNKKHAIKKYGLILSVSAFIHLVLFFLLTTIATKPLPKPVKTNQKAIKSYLYKKPIHKEKPKPIVNKTVEQRKEPQQGQVDKEQTIKKLEEVKELKEVDKNKEIREVKKVRDEKTLNATSDVTQNAMSKPPTQEKTKITTSFSAYKQLDKLRNSINNQIVNEELSQLQQFRSPSVMHGEQIPVPHSEKQLTPEQEREKNTIRMSDSISITKYDNGVCIIEREQFLGSPVEGSSSVFDCGESNFDKSFREHMKKVQAKLKSPKN